MKQLKLTCTQSVYNWILKQLFYLRYLVLKQGKSIHPCSWLCGYVPSFESNSFTDGQWNKYLEWYFETKPFQDWNTIKYRTHESPVKEFKQLYGKWYFKAKMQQYVVREPYFPNLWSAIWLYDSRSLNDVKMGWADHPYGYEIDIELFRNHLGYTIHWNHNGGQEGETVVRSNLGNKRLYKNLQKEYHLFMIDWSEKWIRFYINGILTACFKNEICVPLQIICSKIEMSKTIIQK